MSSTNESTRPAPARATLPDEVVKAAKIISPAVWHTPYVYGEGPLHYATGGAWSRLLLDRAIAWERLARAARVCASALPENDAS